MYTLYSLLLLLLLLLSLWSYSGHCFVVPPLFPSSYSRSTDAKRHWPATTTHGPDPNTKPDYETIVGPWGKPLDRLLMKRFITKLAEQVDHHNTHALDMDQFATITTLSATLLEQQPIPVVQQRAQKVLVNLFPPWLPPQFKILFSRPFPKFSARLNAWATRMFSAWLMGESKLVDIPVKFHENGTVAEMGLQQGVLIQRCRFLEESGCASVCVNACKVPTQNFFKENMGLDLTMEPNYETFECQFSFGRAPNATTESAASLIPCLSRCPTAGSYRSQHVTTTQCDKMMESTTLRKEKSSHQISVT